LPAWKHRSILRKGKSMSRVRKLIRNVWDIAREILDDRAYERYVESAGQQGQEVLTAKEFYLSQLQRKYAKPSRCC
jgi:hypothetical protein